MVTWCPFNKSSWTVVITISTSFSDWVLCDFGEPQIFAEKKKGGLFDILGQTDADRLVSLSTVKLQGWIHLKEMSQDLLYQDRLG
ncbi:hypothetical protein BJY01DRAFT_206144 [Aspergillus pseudoustus]|uniref:Uncharacterized protein n=1 Tax=Aspergillus pseudoustus TaxID=1810923 RepID=A0ABR4KPG8_9EURO